MVKHNLLILGIFACFVSVLVADQTILNSGADAFASQPFPDIVTGSEAYVAVVADWGTGLYQSEGLVWFDLSGLPENITSIESATLKLYFIYASPPGQLEFYRATDAWMELAVTWNTKPGQNRDIISTSSVQEIGAFTVDVTGIVESWVINGYANNGFYIDVPNLGQVVDVYFASKEAPAAETRPKLEINYTAGGGVFEDRDAESIALHLSQESAGLLRISCSVPETVRAHCAIYDVSGSLVNDYFLVTGSQTFTCRCKAGVYFIRIVTPTVSISRKVVIK
jgi:hypothetical protein